MVFMLSGIIISNSPHMPSKSTEINFEWLLFYNIYSFYKLKYFFNLTIVSSFQYLFFITNCNRFCLIDGNHWNSSFGTSLKPSDYFFSFFGFWSQVFLIYLWCYTCFTWIGNSFSEHSGNWTCISIASWE